MVKKVKFFLTSFYVPDNYTPEAIALAEGLAKLGVEVYANIDYWYCNEIGDYVLKKNLDKNYDVAVYDYKYLYHSKKWTFNRIDTSKINILLDRNDWLDQEWRDSRVQDKFDLVLVDHMLKGFKYPQKVKPWAIGITNRIMYYADRQPFDESKISIKRILNNSRVKHNLRRKIQQGLEDNVASQYELSNVESVSIEKLVDDKSASSQDLLYYKESAGRHNPQYYDLLNKYLMTNCVGGYYEYKPFITTPYSIIKKFNRKAYFYLDKILNLTHGDFREANFVFQFDSFRFWEVMYSHSCPIHLDFDYWGLVYPVQPIDQEHYLGIRDPECNDFKEKLSKLSVKNIREIGENGREWCKVNYSPVAVARRLLELIDGIEK